MDRKPKDYMIGGNHYLSMPMQPFEFGLKNRMDPASFSILKYVSRHHLKGGRADLEKAAHIVDILRDHLKTHRAPWPLARSVVHVETFCTANRLGNYEAMTLRLLMEWATGRAEKTDDEALSAIKDRILRIADTIYGKEDK